jgi:HEAT repeat protein
MITHLVMSPTELPKSDVVEAGDRFRQWADSHYPGRPTDYWVFNFDGWDELHTAVMHFVENVAMDRWSDEQMRAVLDAIHYDDEHLYLAREIGERRPDLLIPLANASMKCDSGYAARWQLADQIGRMRDPPPAREEVLLKFAHDDDEYVRRRALEALARIGSAAAEQLALKAWSVQTEAQPWTRMMTLWVLHRIGSPRLEDLLAEAERDQSSHLSEYARKIRRGEVEP